MSQSGAADPVFDRPVFIVSPPRSGSTLLFETLMRAPGVFTIGSESHKLIETIPALQVPNRGFDSNRLSAADATPDVVAELRRRFLVACRDRDGVPPTAGQRFRLLEKTPKNALRIPFLRQAFPEARFVYLHRDPRQVLASMIEAWQSGRFRTYIDLPGWPHPYWSLLLTPGWRALAGQPLPGIVAAQWRAATGILLDDLASLPAQRWCTICYEAFVAAPQVEITRLCDTLDLHWDLTLDQTLPLARYTLSPPDANKWRQLAPEIEPLLPPLQDLIERAARVAGA